MYRVLVVDDEEIVCRGLVRFVKWQSHGFEAAEIAYSAEQAREILSREQIDAVFTDIRMPGETGLDLLRYIQTEFPTVRTVMMSGYSEFSYVQQALRYGAFDYLTKPVNLDEVGLLLDRLAEAFCREQENRKVRDSRIEALLVSVVKGYSAVEQVEPLLPSMGIYCGLRMGILNRELSEAEINKKKQDIKRAIEEIASEVRVLNSDVYELFAILPCRDDEEADGIAARLWDLPCVMENCAAGISKSKNGAAQIAMAYEEAGRAFRYQRAKEQAGIICYKNVETVFSQSTQEIQDNISELITALTDPESRGGAASLLSGKLELLGQGRSITQLQTACIQCLVEINSFLQGLRLQKTDFHGQLNKALENLILCRELGALENCMEDYINLIADKLDEEDEVRLGKGVIRDIQLYICKHYSENIALNLLAKEFYLHPNYLSRLFKEKVGENFIDYITEVRMEKAKTLLANPDTRVADLCMMVGYDNPRYFSKVFKQFTGLTPSEFRERLN